MKIQEIKREKKVWESPELLNEKGSKTNSGTTGPVPTLEGFHSTMTIHFAAS